MTRLYLMLALIAGLIVGVVSTWWIQGTRADAPMAAPADRQVLYWYDPMVPNQHFDRPGKSPFMDMQLVPRYASEADDTHDSLSIDSRQVQNLGMRTARAVRGALTTTARVSGSVVFDERAVTLVQARVAGIVDQLVVRAPLTTVTQGQALLTLIAPDWTAAQAEYLSLRSSRGTGLDPLRAAARQRLGLLGMSESQIQAVERTGRAQDRITLTAPRAGVVGELFVRDGASVTAGTPLLRINGLDPVWVNAAIPEAQLSRVSVGARVEIELPAFPGERFDGAIEALLPGLDAMTRTQTARVVVPNPTHRLLPGMFARVQIAARANAPESMLVPSEAVIATGARHVVIIDAGNGRFRAQEIRVGDEGNGQTAVLEGIDEGDSIVLSGQFLIDSEASLTGALARLGGNATPPSSADTP